MNAKKKAVLERIEGLERAIIMGREYLESGKHANWHGFRPLFDAKVRNGKAAPPHKDWVKNVFLRRKERALKYAAKILRRLEFTQRAREQKSPSTTLLQHQPR